MVSGALAEDQVIYHRGPRSAKARGEASSAEGSTRRLQEFRDCVSPLRGSTPSMVNRYNQKKLKSIKTETQLR